MLTRDEAGVEHADLVNFTIPEVQADPIGHIDYFPARQVQNPIVLWYNNVNHFQPFHFVNTIF